MRIGSLFSGIGGLELGLEMAGLGETVWQVEQNPFCRSVLAKHWPSATRYNDVCSVGGKNLEQVDLVCGGFPCQDVSSAGKGAGLAGRRSGLWFEFARIVSELRPQWVVVENVASGANAWVDAVQFTLAEFGYDSLSFPIEARDAGAPYKRTRVFVVAFTNSDLQPARPLDGQVAKLPKLARVGWRAWGQPVPPVRGVDDGPSTAMDRDRLTALGNAVVPQCAEVVGWVIRYLQMAQEI